MEQKQWLGGSIYNQTNLKKVIIPDSVTSIGDSNFFQCSNLNDIVMSKTIQNIGPNCFIDTAFYNNQADGLVYLENALLQYKGTVPDNSIIQVKDGTTCIGSRALRGSNIASVELPDTIIGISEEAFYGCSGLSSFKMSSNVKYIGNAAFAGCTSLKEIVILSNVDQIGRRSFGDWTNSQTIKFNNESKGENWDDNWNKDCNANIVWAYTGK